MNRQELRRFAITLALGLPVGLVLLSPAALRAQDEGARVFLALASGAQETPSVESPGVAFGRFVLSADEKQLSYAIRISGLKGAVTAMRLHRGRPGAAGDVVYELSAPVDGKALGSVAFNASDGADLTSQGLYLNIQTEAQPDGEVRGQVVPSPDPAIGQEQEESAGQEVSFSGEIQPIFTANCSCHMGQAPQAEMNLEAGQAYANIVNVKSGESPLDRIEPGDPAKSYLLHKLNDTQGSVGGSGARMPLGGAPLPADQIAKITAWVQQGAKNN